jgi:hypothetical protein
MNGNLIVLVRFQICLDHCDTTETVFPQVRFRGGAGILLVGLC